MDASDRPDVGLGGEATPNNTHNQDTPKNHPADALPRRPSERSRRAVTVAVLVAACTLAYGLILHRVDLSKGPNEVELGASAADARVRLYLQPLQIDTVNDSLQVRISVVPDASTDEAAPTIADRDFLLKIRRGKQIEHVRVNARQPLPEVTFDFDLEGGSVRDYPLDRYLSLMTLAATEQAQDGTEKPLPIHVTAWEGLLGFSVKCQPTEMQPPGGLRLQFDISRTGPVMFFGIATYVAMIVMTMCALAIGSLVFIGIRRIEVTLVGALGAMIFALPSLRNALPGSPPLGVRADILVFFWAELGAIVALCLFTTAWARRGAQPVDEVSRPAND
jgi:hypothetical protein